MVTLVGRGDFREYRSSMKQLMVNIVFKNWLLWWGKRLTIEKEQTEINLTNPPNVFNKGQQNIAQSSFNHRMLWPLEKVLLLVGSVGADRISHVGEVFDKFTGTETAGISDPFR